MIARYLFVKLKYHTLKYYLFVLNILCVTYFLTSITMPNPQTSNIHHIYGNYVSAPSGISPPYQAVNAISKRSFRRRLM